MTKEKILKAIGTDAWDKIKKLAFGEKPAGESKETTLKNGTPITYNGDLVIGTAISVLTTEGETPITDGNHELGDGTAFTTHKGVVETVTAAEGEKAPDSPAGLQQKIEAVRHRHAVQETELTVLKQQFATLKAENAALQTTLARISKVLEILVETTPDEPVRNRQFARTQPTTTKAERIAALLNN